jgi:hypothetical protein
MLNENTSTDPFCKFDDHMLQLFTSCLFLAGAVAAMIGSWTCKRYGRKATMVAGEWRLKGAWSVGRMGLVNLEWGKGRRRVELGEDGWRRAHHQQP